MVNRTNPRVQEPPFKSQIYKPGKMTYSVYDSDSLSVKFRFIYLPYRIFERVYQVIHMGYRIVRAQ